MFPLEFPEAASADGFGDIDMESHRRGLISCSIVAAILAAGSVLYGLIRGVPQWNTVLQGQLDPVILAYGGWPLATGIVAVGLAILGGCIAVSWEQRTFHYLILALGLLSGLVFVALGLPGQVLGLIVNTLSFVVVGLCALLLAGVFAAALRERLTRRYRA